MLKARDLLVRQRRDLDNTIRGLLRSFGLRLAKGKGRAAIGPNACRTCAIKNQCATGNERRITRWEHEHVVEAVQKRLDANPQAMRQRRETVKASAAEAP